MIPYNSGIGEASSQDDDNAALLKSPDGYKESSGPKFQPGDHVIRWELLKFAVWPIQVHGIVLSVKGSSSNTTSSGDNYIYTIADFGYTSSQSLDKKENGDGKGKGNIFKQVGNINRKMKSFYKNSNTVNSSRDALRKSYMNISQRVSFESLGSPRSPKSQSSDQNGTQFASFDSFDNSEKFKDEKDSTDTKEVKNGNKVSSDSTFDVETKDDLKRRRRFQVVEITNPDILKKWHKIDYGKSLFKKAKIKDKVAKSTKNLLEKMKIRKKQSERYSNISTDQDNVGTSAIAPSSEDDSPKLPKSDPRKIVLARTRYILDQQDLPECEQTLPPYHILYSNSECLAVWCKTGKFSTLQAAVFLHSTAVGNAKSTFLMTGAVVATQPWLIPVVGIYGAVAIGMPYIVLKKCKEKWRKSEQQLTDGFWSTADCEVFVAAVENWSSIDPSKKEPGDT